MPAIDIFSLALKYLSEKMLKFITEKVGIASIRPSNILWVLTVPAIWKPGARQFMRKAAYKVLIIPQLFDIAKYLLLCVYKSVSLICVCTYACVCSKPITRSYMLSQTTTYPLGLPNCTHLSKVYIIVIHNRQDKPVFHTLESENPTFLHNSAPAYNFYINALL